MVGIVVEAVDHEKVAIKFSPCGTFGGMYDGQDSRILAQYAYVISELKARAKAGRRLAYILLVGPRVNNPVYTEGQNAYLDSTTVFAFSIRKGLIIRAGNLALHPEVVREMVEDGRTLIGYERIFVAKPNPDRIANGLHLNPYDRSTFYCPGSGGYTGTHSMETAHYLFERHLI